MIAPVPVIFRVWLAVVFCLAHLAVGTATALAFDADFDGIDDDVDNCIVHTNPLQIDTDCDGHGNRCDADLNNDCIVNSVDLGIFKTRFFSEDAEADFDGNGVVNPIDLGIFRTLFFAPPGPSAAGVLCNSAPGGAYDCENCVFVSLDGTDNNPGLTPCSPVQTLQRALSIAQADPTRGRVLVSHGTYSGGELLIQSMPGDLVIEGGYSEDFRTRDSGRALYLASSTRALVLQNLTTQVEIEQIDFFMIGNLDFHVGIVANNIGDRLTLRQSGIRAGRPRDGAAGGSGAQGSPGGQGSGAAGSSGGSGGFGGGGNGANGRNRAPGLAGVTGADNGNSPTCGGSGGAGAGSAGLGCADGDPGAGSNGGPGCTGDAGNNGSTGNGLGTLSGVNWTRSNGSSGFNGRRGGGGGGGGSGGGEDCTVLGQCVFCGTGRGGGGGGGGGEGGSGGSGGEGGGASVGIVVHNSTVTLEDVQILTDGGGDGGAGGTGGAGGLGGIRGLGASNSDDSDGDGGDGGAGGPGGAGGCGGGGGGGPSFGIWGSNANAARVNATNVTYIVGNGGLGGASVCGNNGQNGMQGNATGVTIQ